MLASALFVLVLPLVILMPPARSAERSIAILVVGDETGGILTRREKDLFRQLAAWRTRAKLSKSDLPIISYHVNKDDERQYCEKALGIKRSSLLFVGLVEHESRVPQKVLFRVNNVTDASKAADRVMAEVVSRLGLDPAILTDTPTPAESPTVVASPTPARPRGVSLLKVVTVDRQSRPQSRFLTTDHGVYVNVFLHNDNPSVDQKHTLAVRCIDSEGRPYARPMGGTFNVVAGELIDTADMLRRADPDRHNGFLIRGNMLERRPGRYQIIIEVDGEVLGRGDFEIVPAR